MKKIIVSSIAAAALSTAAFAANSTIYFGSDVNGTASELGLSGASKDVNASASGLNEANTTGSLAFITYVPNIGIGKGNLITVHVTNGGAIHSVNANELYLVDTNSTDQNASSSLVVARMTDFTSDGNGNYTHMTFKFDHDVASQATLAMGNIAETNASLTADNNKQVGRRDAKLALVIPQGLSCGENVNIEVINSTDQSAQSFPVANAPTNGTGVTVEKEYYIDDAAATEAGAGLITQSPENKTSTTDCPYFECTIALPNETEFSTTTTSSTNCPSCTNVVTTQDLTCEGEILIKKVTPDLTSTSVTATNVQATLTTSTSFSGISSIQTYADSTKKVSMTTSGTVASATLTNTTHNLNLAADEYVAYVVNADGTTVLTPRDFDLGVKLGDGTTTYDLDTIQNFIILDDNTQSYSIAYMNELSDYRTFVRMTNSSSADAQVMATVYAENGNSSTEFDTGYVVPAKGAVIVEASKIAETARANGLTDADFSAVGGRYNVTFTIKTTAATNIDMVAYQTAGGSQRYLPVSGATGGGRN